jgi:hypothetical protein
MPCLCWSHLSFTDLHTSLFVTEDASYPICEEVSEWGGVHPQWWKDAVTKYGWDVDPDSIRFDFEFTWYFNRYNVIMKKRNESSVQGGEELVVEEPEL